MIFKTLNNWGIISTFKIILGEIYCYFFETKFKFKKINNTNTFDHLPTPLFILKEIEEFLINKKLNNSIIIDVGSGSGRFICYMQKRKFRKIIGIENDDILFKCAINNIKKNNLDKKKIKLINKDVFDFKFPKKTKVIYIFNPFNKSNTIKFISKIHKSLKNDVFVIYVTPIFLKEFIKKGYKIFYKRIIKKNRGYVILKN